MAAKGRLVSAKLTPTPSAINLRAYAVLARDRTLYLTLINKEHGSGRRDAEVNFAPVKGYVRGQVMVLTAPGGNVEAKAGVTLGGASIDNAGHWSGAWTPLPEPSASGQFKLLVPAATAAIVKLTTD